MIVQLPLILGFACYFAINLYLWSLRISNEALLVVAFPLGVLFFVFMMWRVLRTNS